jgi:hypothetical protein
MNVFVFTNSTGCMCYEGSTFIPNASYVDMLQEYNPEGMWINGVTALHVSRAVSLVLKGAERIAILHFGVCEALSHPPANFLNLWIAHLFQQVVDPYLFQTFIVPKMLKASEVLTKDARDYFCSLLPSEFAYILEGILWKLQGTKTIFIGMSQPNTASYPHWQEQALEYNEVMKNLCLKWNVYFIDIWDLLKEHVQDSNHINIEGHKILYNLIVDKMAKGA